MNHLLAGMLVRLQSEPDGTYAIPCPSCNHLTPITDVMRTPETFTQAVAWIECPCQHGHSRPAIGNTPVTACPCVARYQIAPTGTRGMYSLAAVDHTYMRQALLARAEMEYLSLDDGTMQLYGVSVPENTLDYAIQSSTPPRRAGRRAKRI